MKSKRITIKVIIFLGLVLSLSSCSGDNQVDPIGITMQMQKAIDKDDYEKFKSLFFEPRQSHASQELFQQLQKIKVSSSKTNFKSYTLMTLENGEMVLVNLTPNSKGKSEIQDVIIVPDELKNFFLEH